MKKGRKKATVLNILSGYGLAKVTYVDEQIATRAKYDMSNVDTADLATEGHGHAGKNLAYADTSNINTADLVLFGLGFACGVVCLMVIAVLWGDYENRN